MKCFQKLVHNDVIFRLEAYDRNFNFGRPSELEDEYVMQLPDISLYKDLHADMNIPTITSESVTSYLSSYAKCIDKTCKDLYESGFVNFIRLAVPCSGKSNFLF